MTFTDPSGLSRIEPLGPVQAYGTHLIQAPSRPASCKEVECPLWETGWTTLVDPNMQMGPERIIYIRMKCGRRFSEHVRDDGMHEFFFYPHQICFVPHKAPAGPERFWWRNGDWRGNPTGDRIKFDRPDDWVDHMATRFDQWATARERG